MELSRRDFVKSAGYASAALLAAGTTGISYAVDATSEVYVGKGKATETITKILDKMGGMSRFVKPGARVILKPNMSFANDPSWATTTSPEAVRVVAQLCLDAGAKRVIICDYTLREPEICKAKTGIGDAVKDMKGVVIFTPTEESLFEERTDSRAKTLTNTKVVKEVLKADTLICLPAAKSHGAGGVSLTLKGLMGLVWDRGSMHGKMDLHKAVAEQLYYMKPTLSIIDGTRALLDNGPAGPGKVMELNTFVAGTDPVATDSFGVTLAPWYGRQFTGLQVAHIKFAAEYGFGNAESSKIKEISV